MEETQKSYEALVMLSCKTGGEGVDTIVDKLKSLVVERADLEFCKEWGKKKLAYPVNKEAEAYYVLFDFVSKSDFPAEFVRICRITDGVLRTMVVKHVVKKKKVSKRALKKAKADEVSDPAPEGPAETLGETASDVSSEVPAVAVQEEKA